MKTLDYQWLNTGDCGSSKGIVLCEFGNKKVKMTYECANAYDRFKIEIFDGFKFNTVATMSDMGVKSNTSTYVKKESDIFERFENLKNKGVKYIKKLLI